MSKVTKLIYHPKLFFEDMILKKLNAKRKNTKIGKRLSIHYDTENQYNTVVHLIHTGEGIVNGKAHLLLWLNNFESSREKYAVMIRNYDLYQWFKKEYPQIKAIFARTALDVEEVINLLPCLKGMYYLSNTGNLIHTLRFNDYQHIFLGHGDSDKAASAHKFFRVYDEIWVSGQAHIDRFKNTNIKINNVEFIKIGRPGLKEFFSNKVSISNKDKNVKIVYLPTWEGSFVENDYSSVRHSFTFVQIIQKQTNCQFIIKYHPSTGNRDKTIHDEKQKFLDECIGDNDMFKFIDQTESINDLIGQGDAFICDISAVVSECIPTLKPIFIYIPEDKNIVISKSNLTYSDYAYVFRDNDELEKLIHEVVICGKDTLKNKRVSALNYLIGVKETLNDEFNTQLKRISSKH